MTAPEEGTESCLLVDPLSGAGFRLDGGRGTYYGLCRLNGSLCVGARGRLSSHAAPVGASNNQLLLFDASLRLSGSLRPPFPIRELHQILEIDGKLWATCTFDNFVAIFDGEGWERWYPLGVPGGEFKDVNHFNSLSLVDNTLCVVASNHGPSEILMFDLPERRLGASVRLGEQAHNVWKQGTQWMTCSSAEGRIVGSDGFSLEVGGFPRGVAFSDGFAYVGVSERAERPTRDQSGGHVAIFDSDWNRAGTLPLPGEGIITDLAFICVDPRLCDGLGPVEFRRA
jgi:hypothetical protein